MRRRTYLFFGIFVCILLVPLLALGDSGNIASLVFTTNPQTIAAGVASQAITVQTENSGATAEKVSETNDVTFTSTSGTGEFLNSTGGAVSTTMSTNTASRTFYYEDSTPGTYTLTVSIKGRTSGDQFSATQTITISGGGSTSSETSNTSSDDSATSSTPDNPPSDSGEDSSQAYWSQSAIYQGPDDEAFDVSIGRNRLVSVGEPVVFDAKLIPDSASYSGIDFHFAFGDGTDWEGSSATHTYAYPGDYIVVVDANRNGDEAVAEAKVKVVSADISIADASDDSVAVFNNGDDEINLGNWVLADSVDRFVVPQDTIVAAHSSITIPASVMKMKKFVGAVNIYNSSVMEMAAAPTSVGAAAGNVAIALPDGMTADEFEERFTAALHPTNVVATAQGAAPTKPVGGRALLGQAASQTASSSNIAAISASSSLAAAVYTIPRPTGTSIFSNIASWIGGLFGK